MTSHSRHPPTMGTTATNMLMNIRKAASSVTRTVTDSYTKSDVTVGKTPEFLTHNFFLITEGLPGDTPEIILWRLLKLMVYDDASHYSSLTLYCSMAIIFNTFLKKVRIAECKNCGMLISEVNIGTFLAYCPELEDAEIEVIDMYRNAIAAHYIYAFSLYSNMLGKQLSSLNYTFWIKRRKQTYSAPLGLTKDDELLDWLTMSRSVAERTYSDLKIYFQIRRLMFYNIYAFSKTNGLLSKGLSITVNLLRYAEMANFYIISNWISILNPDLWGWNELAKYLPFIEAAQDKYESVGEMAPWCKLILPEDEVQEFHAQKLQLPFTVAKKISSEYGSGTITNLQGDIKNAQIRAVVDHAMFIVKVAGGARTIDTIAIRYWRYNGYDNKKLYETLDKGALLVDVAEQALAQEPDQREA